MEYPADEPVADKRGQGVGNPCHALTWPSPVKCMQLHNPTLGGDSWVVLNGTLDGATMSSSSPPSNQNLRNYEWHLRVRETLLRDWNNRHLQVHQDQLEVRSHLPGIKQTTNKTHEQSWKWVYPDIVTDSEHSGNFANWGKRDGLTHLTL